MNAFDKLSKLTEDIEPDSDPILWDILRAGTERSWDCEEDDGKTLTGVLRGITDQFEDEQGYDVETVRHDAYEAWEWVREHGGLESVRKRFIPEGYEWPRYEDGEMVMFEDELPEFSKTIYKTVKTVMFQNNGCVVIENNGGSANRRLVLWNNERVKRHPILAADGEPLEVGQTVWDTDAEADTPLTVVEVSSDLVRCEYTWKDGKTYRPCYPPSVLTHQRPVLDADGVPIKVGDTVYLLHGEWCDEFPCLGFHGGEELEVFADGEAVHVSGSVQCREKGASHRCTCYPQPSQLTHTKPEPPDSWERIEEDALSFVEDNAGIPHDQDQMERDMLDILRRCKALAERGER